MKQMFIRRVTLVLVAALLLGGGSKLWAQGETEAEVSGEQAPAGFLEIVFSGGITGALIMVVLIALSIVTAYLIIDHFLTVRRKDLMPPGLDEEVKNLLVNGKIEQAQQACQQQPSLLAFVLLHGIAELEYGWTAVEKTLEDALAEQAARLFRKIEYLNVIGNLSPMVGLLGTVVGIVMAFQQVAQSQGTAGAAELASGIYQALVTTVGGLLVAIPALGAFAVFRNRIDQFVAESAFLAQHVFGPLRKKKRPTEKA
jgi:biopolymer transport protein ExbB